MRTWKRLLNKKLRGKGNARRLQMTVTLKFNEYKMLLRDGVRRREARSSPPHKAGTAHASWSLLRSLILVISRLDTDVKSPWRQLQKRTVYNQAFNSIFLYFFSLSSFFSLSLSLSHPLTLAKSQLVLNNTCTQSVFASTSTVDRNCIFFYNSIF